MAVPASMSALGPTLSTGTATYFGASSSTPRMARERPLIGMSRKLHTAGRALRVRRPSGLDRLALVGDGEGHGAEGDAFHVVGGVGVVLELGGAGDGVRMPPTVRWPAQR